jgi:glycosyltransferase involved in cell wall biosynthesis
MDPKKIRLLKFVSDFNIGGTERQVLALAREFHPSRLELHLGCLRRRGELLEEIQAAGIPLNEYRIPRLHSFTTMRQQLKFARYLKKECIDIVHAYGFYAITFAVPAARFAGVPAIVASIRDIGDHLTPMKRRVQREICRMADCVLANAEAVRQNLLDSGYNGEKIAVIRNGISLTRYLKRGSSNRLRNELAVPADAPLVAVLSRLRPLKGIEYFLQAAAILGPRFPHARFLLIGDGPYREKLEQYVAQLELGRRVIFMGFRLEVPKLLSEITISVLPSLSEGLSNALLESMAAGIPVVATRVGGNPELIEDGTTGLLVPPRDPQALAGAMSLLLGNPDLAERMGAAARQRVAERFPMQLAIRTTERLYQRLLRRGSVPQAGHYKERLS